MRAGQVLSTAEIRALVRRCLARDEHAARKLVEHYQARVFTLCLRMLGHRQDAEDVAQESLLRALRGLRNWDQNRDFAPWLLAIACNRCRTWLAARSRRHRAQGDLEHVEDRTAAERGESGLAEEVDLALADLRGEYRQAFLLFHEQELSYLQIAQALDCPIGTAKTWVHRARQELVAKLRQREVIAERTGALRRV